MGFGAIIGAVGSLASAGAGIAGSLMGGGGGGPNLGDYAKKLNQAANQYILPFTDPSKWDIDVLGMTGQAINFGLNKAPDIDRYNMTQLQTLLSQAMPGWQEMFQQMRLNTTSLLGGGVPQDVQDQIRRSAAFTSLMGGSAGAGTGTTGAITARDLGLTSLQLQQQGQQQGTNLLTFARNYLMPQPINPLSLLPASELISAAEWSKSAVFQANEAAYTAKANAAAAGIGAPSQPLAGVGGAVQGLLSNLTTQNPQTGKSPLSSLLGLFGGGGGGGSILNTSQDPDPDLPYLQAAGML